MTETPGLAHRIVVHVPEKLVLLDVAGPADVFATATLLGASRAYEMTYVSERGGSMPAWNGLRLETEAADTFGGEIDTLLLPGSLIGPDQAGSAAEQTQIRRLATASTRVACVCTGVFRLAETGCLDGYEATTHWAYRENLAAAHPAVKVVDDSLHVSSGRFWSTAGASAGMDLALALVEADHGAKLAREVARWLVLYVRRPGGQQQISTHLIADDADNPLLRDALARIANHPGEDHSLSRLASRAGWSERHFARVFRRETGLSLAEHVTGVRLETARRLLENTGLRVTDVARRSGFGTVETLNRAYRRHLGTSPTAVRRDQAVAERPSRLPWVHDDS